MSIAKATTQNCLHENTTNTHSLQILKVYLRVVHLIDGDVLQLVCCGTTAV